MPAGFKCGCVTSVSIQIQRYWLSNVEQIVLQFHSLNSKRICCLTQSVGRSFTTMYWKVGLALHILEYLLKHSLPHTPSKVLLLVPRRPQLFAMLAPPRKSLGVLTT